MVDNILKGFSCEAELYARVDKMAESPLVFDQAVAMGLLALKWRPASLREAIQTTLGEGPRERAKEWARSLGRDAVKEIRSMRDEMSRGLNEDLISLLCDETDWNEAERAHVQVVQDQLAATSFILDAVLDDADTLMTGFPARICQPFTVAS